MLKNDIFLIVLWHMHFIFFCKYRVWVPVTVPLDKWLFLRPQEWEEQTMQARALDFRESSNGGRTQTQLQLQRRDLCPQPCRCGLSVPQQALLSMFKNSFCKVEANTEEHESTLLPCSWGMSLPCRLLAQDPSSPKHQAVPEWLLLP